MQSQRVISGPNPNLEPLTILSRLLFSTALKDDLARELSREQFDLALSLASSHHVVMRCMQDVREMGAEAADSENYEWATNAIDRERARIEHALGFLRRICDVLASQGCEVVVIKSLDHWPDLGSDLDLYSNAKPEEIIRVMSGQFSARAAPRSWGDRLANKWNFVVPGLPELVEIHIGRLGQTGELGNFAQSLINRSRVKQVGPCSFRVPSASDRLMICTLQRMYRHFYIRLCDVADTAQLLETENINYDDLQDAAQAAGIWRGVATFLKIVSDYVAGWRGKGIALPDAVQSAAQFGAEQIPFANGFLRVPLMPHSVRLYASEWKALMLRGEVRSTARLSLLPCLATAAAVGMKLTGNDKGIW